MKTLKKVIPTIIWILFLLIGYFMLVRKANMFGQNSVDALNIFIKRVLKSKYFYAINILFITQLVIMLTNIKHKKIIVLCLCGAVVAVCYMFGKEMYTYGLMYRTAIDLKEHTEQEFAISRIIFTNSKYAIITGGVGSIVGILNGIFS